MEAIYISIENHEARQPETLYGLSMSFEIFSSQTKVIQAGKREFVQTGITIKVPHNNYCLITGHPLLAPSVTAPPTYIGPGVETSVSVFVHNNETEDLVILRGEKIALLSIQPINQPTLFITHPRPQNYTADEDEDLNNINISGIEPFSV